MESITDHLPELRACAVWQFHRLLECTTEKAMLIEQVLYDFILKDYGDVPECVQWEMEQVRKAYRNKLYTLVSNIQLDHVTLKQELLKGNQRNDLETIISKDERCFADALWQHLKQQQETLEHAPPEQELRLESQIECYRCKKAKKYARNVETTQVQTRSADEPMTIFCVCRGCGQKWRMY